MSISNLKLDIQQKLQACKHGALAEPSRALLETLGYRSDKRLDLIPNSAAGFQAQFDPQGRMDAAKALLADWRSVDLLQQITADELGPALGAQGQLFINRTVDGSNIQSYLFFAVDLAGAQYTRTQLATVAREINKLFPMPALVIFRYGESLTLAIIARRVHKRDTSRDVLEKVTLIKDIRCASPHRAHVEILADLALPSLAARHDLSTFVDLQRAWEKTLDTSELNKKFFREVANWYFWAVQHVTFPDGAGDDPETRNAVSVIRLITRLIFVWFIREKGLAPAELFDERALRPLLRWNDPNRSTYYKAILQNLFFATLNTEMGEDRRFRGRNPAGRDQHYGISTVYRYENYFADPAAALRLFASVPFLNGGLFECLDRPSQKVRVDGFSDRADNPLAVPDFLFFGDEQEIDLNDVFGTRNKRYQARGLLRIFDSYKFTIEENTPIEEEIALDPELLGKVFENLLAAYNPETHTTARKQTGSFYTPREIVDYMVDESLLAYLETALATANPSGLADRPEGFGDRLRGLLAYSDAPHGFDAAETAALIAAIDRLKMLDPACGSGAFPMGMLHKLVFVLSKLDPDNAQWQALQLQKALAETEEAYRIGDRGERQERLRDIEEAFTNNTSDYGRKLYLIENCIYGVDIQPIAVQIAKLRFFISLVVDQRVDDSRPNRGIRPLPNLETKFVAANTLIGIARPKVGGVVAPSFGDHVVADLRASLANIRHRMFSARTPSTKRALREEDARLRQQMAEVLTQGGWDAVVASQLAAWDPYDQNTHADFFDAEWMFGMMEGFDVVMGNPPYLRVQGIQQTQAEYMPYYRNHFQSAQGSFDLYALFIERGYQLLNSHGQFAYIVPHKFFQATFGEALRRLLTKRKALRQIVRFGSAQVFEEATTYTCLLFLGAQPNTEFDLLEVKTLTRGDEVLQAARQRTTHPDYVYDRLPSPTSDNGRPLEWDFSVGEDSRVLRRLQQHPRTLGSLVRKIFQGIATSADKIFVLEIRQERGDTIRCFSKHLDEELEVERGLVKPFLMGKDVHRYEPMVTRSVVVFPYEIRNGKAELMSQEYIQRNFPLGWAYLKRNKDELAGRERGRFVENWHAFSRPQNLIEFETVKVMTPDICGKPEMSIDLLGELYHTTTLYSFVFKPDVKRSLKLLLGVLNSKVLWYFLSMTGSVLRGGYLRFKTEYLKPFPIADSTPEQERAIEALVDYVLCLKAKAEPTIMSAIVEQRVMTSYFEQLIDALVYEMYFPEEFSAADKIPSRLLTSDRLPALAELSADKPKALETLFQQLYAPSHPVRSMIFFLDSLETVRVIEAKSRRL